MEKHNEKKLKNMLSDRAKYHKKFQKGMSPFCSLTGEPISIGGGLCENKESLTGTTQDIGKIVRCKRNAKDRFTGEWRIVGVREKVYRGYTDVMYDLKPVDMPPVNTGVTATCDWLDMELVPEKPAAKETPKRDGSHLLKKYLTPESFKFVHDVEDVSTPCNWHSDGAIVTFMYGADKYRLDVQGGWTNDSNKFWLLELKNLTKDTYYQKIDKSGRDIGYVYGSLDIGKLLTSSNWSEVNPRGKSMKTDHLTDSLNKSEIKEGFVGKPEVGKTYWFKHSGGIRSGEFTRQTTSLNCFYVPEVDREVCIPIWANIATSREDIEGIEGVVDKMARDTQLPRYMVKDNPVKNPYPPKNRYDENINKFPGRAQLIGALKTFDRNGEISTRGNWRVANGGYDLAFEVYYNNTPVAQGYSDGTLTTDFDTTEFGFSKSDLRDVITSVYSDMKTGETLTEAPDMFGVMTDDELDADEAERRARFEKDLADRRKATAERRQKWQQHKPAYDEAVKKFQEHSGAVINKLAKDIESGKLLQWGYYETPNVVVSKSHGGDFIVFKPVKLPELRWGEQMSDSDRTQRVLTKWLDSVTYNLTSGKINFNYYKNDIQYNLDAYNQLVAFLEVCATAVDGWISLTEKDNAEATQKAMSRFLNDFVDTPSKIDCAFDCSNPGHYRHGGRYYIFSIGGKVYHYEDYDSGAYTNNHVHQLSTFNQIGIKNHIWYYDNPVITKINPSNVGLQIKGDVNRTCYVEGGKVDINKLISLSESFNKSLNEKKKKKPYDSINYNAGNVEHNISMFNKMNNPIAQPTANPVNGNIGGEGCCEALEDRKKEMREGMRLTNGMREDESLYFDDGDYSYHIFRRTPFGSNAETEWAVLVVDYGLRFHHDKMYKDEKTGIDTVPVDVVHDKPKKIAYFEFTDETLPEAANAFLDEDGKKFVEVIKAEAQKHIEITEDLDTDATPNDVITEVGKQELRDFLTSIICEREDDLALEFGEDDRLWDEFFEVNLESYTDKYREDIIKHFNLTTKED